MTPADSTRAIIRYVAAECGVPVDALLSASRQAPIVRARAIAIRSVKAAKPGFSLRKLGHIFGRGHRTIAYHLSGNSGHDLDLLCPSLPANATGSAGRIAR